jgi:Zn-finger nucleic acid-binding protein
MKLLEDKEYLVCEYCTYTYVPEPNPDGVRVLEEATPLGCPVCGIQMVKASLNGNRMWSCKKCRGLLLPMALFTNTVFYERRKRSSPPTEKLPPVDVPKELQRKIVCPQCADPMDTHPYAGPGNVVIDNCPKCRLNWLDYRELQRILLAPERIFKDESWLPSWLDENQEEAE